MSHLFVSRFNNQYVTIVIILFVFLSTKLKNVHSLARHGGIWWLHVEIFFKTSSCAFESRKGKKCKNNWKATFEEKTGKLSSIAKVNRSIQFFFIYKSKYCVLFIINQNLTIPFRNMGYRSCSCRKYHFQYLKKNHARIITLKVQGMVELHIFIMSTLFGFRTYSSLRAIILHVTFVNLTIKTSKPNSRSKMFMVHAN